MKTSSIKKYIALGLALAGAAFTPSLHANTPTEIFIEGGSASSSVLFDRATNFYNGGTLTSATYNSGSTVAQFVGNATNAALLSLNPITIDINIANGAVAGLDALLTQTAQAGDTNLSGSKVPVLVDSATLPKSIGKDGSQLVALQTYVVPLVFVKNTKAGYPDSGITNLTQRQAVSLETSTPLPATYYGGTSTNPVYFVGRNSQAAVRTVIDFSIYNVGSIQSYYTNGSSNLPQLDGSADPGLSSGGLVANTTLAITNSIGTVAVQNIKTGLTPLAYEGVPYSVSNVINGSYPIWGYENYYYLDPTKVSNANGSPTGPQLAVINAFYQLVTNATFQTSSYPVFGNNFVPTAALQVTRSLSADGGQITPK